MFSQQQKEFLSKIRSISRSRSLHRTFSDWLEVAAISMHQLPYHSGELPKDYDFEALEACYMKQIKLYSKDELLVFSELLGLTISAHHNDYGDFLGEIAGEAALLSKRGGQFFTPYSLCQMMAKMSFGSVKSQIEEKGVLTVCEPAVGAGALVIASAEEVASQGVNPCAHLQFDCTDVSRDAFNMAYIQLSALGLQAIVHHGNTLSMEIWESRPTLQLRMFDQWLESKREEQRLVQSMQSLLAGTYTAEPESWDSGSAGETSSNQPLFDLEQFSGESSKRQRSHQKPDVVLDRQMNLFG